MGTRGKRAATSRFGASLAAVVGLALAALLLAAGCGPATAAAAASSPPHGIEGGTRFTPLAASLLTTPMAVQGTDGKLHLAYELELTNAVLAQVDVQRVDVLDGGGNMLLSLEGDALRAAIVPLGTPPPAEGDVQTGPTTLPASSSSVVWLDVQLPSGTPAPAALQHRVTVSIGGTTAALDGMAPVRTAPGPPVVLGPPVRPGIWYASDGCCIRPTHHRRGLVPVNGTLMVPQRFAIDWFMLDSQHRAWVGDPSKLSSYVSFEQPVIASADAQVVDVQDGLPDNGSLPNPPPIPPIENTVGNHVILKVRDGLYLLYAHLEHGTIDVHEGQTVRRGQVLGKIGSSGNSTTPHLHFQVMTTATFFPTDSPPYVFDRFQLLGTITDRIWDDNLGLQPNGTLPFQAAPRPDRRTDEMPLDRDVVRFEG